MNDINKGGMDPSTQERLLRGVYAILFLVIGYLFMFVIFLIAILQYLASIIFKSPNDQLEKFGRSLSVYASEIIDYLTYVSDEKPFPFKPWPKG